MMSRCKLHLYVFYALRCNLFIMEEQNLCIISFHNTRYVFQSFAFFHNNLSSWLCLLLPPCPQWVEEIKSGGGKEWGSQIKTGKEVGKSPLFSVWHLSSLSNHNLSSPQGKRRPSSLGGPETCLNGSSDAFFSNNKQWLFFPVHLRSTALWTGAKVGEGWLPNDFISKTNMWLIEGSLVAKVSGVLLCVHMQVQ